MKFRFKKSILPIILCLALIITVLPNVNDIVRASGDEGTAAVSGNELNGTEPTDPGNESSVLSLQSSAPAAAPSESSQEPSSSSDESSAAVTGGAKGNDVTSGSDESTQAATEGSSEASTDRSAEDPDGSISGNAVDETGSVSGNELPSVSGNEIPGESKTEFVYEDGTIRVTATLSSPDILPAGAELKVVPVNSGAEYDKAAELVAAKAQEQEADVHDMMAYDISFVKDGKEVEPAGKVSVSMEFVQKVALAAMEEETTELNVYHMEDSETVTDVEATVETTDEGIEKVEFETESFSMYIISVVGTVPAYTSQLTSGNYVNVWTENDFSQVNGFTKDRYHLVVRVIDADTNNVLETQPSRGYFQKQGEETGDISISVPENINYELVKAVRYYRGYEGRGEIDGERTMEPGSDGTISNGGWDMKKYEAGKYDSDSKKRLNYLDIYVKAYSAETSVTVEHEHADGSVDTENYQISRTGSADIPFRPAAGESYDIITVSNGDFDSNVALKADGSGITVTGSRRINGVVIRIRYTKPMEDTLKIEKSLGGKVENTAEDEYRWWINFAMSGQASTVNTQPVDVLFVIDRSGSMSNKIGNLKNALNGDGSASTPEGRTGFISGILNANENNRVALVDYSGTGYAVDSVNFTRDEETLKSHVTGLNANGGTQTDSGLEKAKELVAAVPEYRTSHKIVILLTDGAPSQQGLDGRPYGEAISANEQADAIKQLGAEIYTINYDISSSGSISVSTSRNSQGQYEGSASTDDNGNKSFIITPSQYDSTIGVDNRLGLQFWRYGSNSTDWYASADDFISGFLTAVASTEANYYTSGSGEIATILNQILVSVLNKQIATNATITDVAHHDNFNLYLPGNGTELVAQYRVAGGAWVDLPKYDGTGTAPDNYYSLGAERTVDLHFAKVVAEGTEVRFQIEAKPGVYSSAEASEENPDLLTNDKAEVHYTDVNGDAQHQTSEDPNSYKNGSDLTSPEVYIEPPAAPVNFRLTKSVTGTAAGNASYADDEFEFVVEKTTAAGITSQETVKLKAGEVKIFPAFEGDRFTVKEVIEENGNYLLKAIHKDGEALPLTAATAEVLIGKTDMTVEFVNELKIDSVTVNKTAKLIGAWEDRTYQINIEVSAEDVEIPGITETAAYDIVLVLDNSGSMWSNKMDGNKTRMSAMKDAAKLFVDNILKDSPESRIAVVYYNSSSSTACRFISNGTDIKEAIDSLPYNNRVTRPDLGMKDAAELFRDYSTDENSKAVVFFTDGVPYSGYGSGSGESWSSGTGELSSTGLANKAIAYADSFRSDYDAKIFAVGVFKGLDDSTKQKVDAYMTNVAGDASRYLTADTVSDLELAFSSIGSSIVSKIGKADVTDVLDPRFELAPGERERLISEGATVSADGMTVTWPESTITGGGFHKTIKVVAREEFLGGNDVTTNAPGSQVTINGAVKPLPEPIVNVYAKFAVDPEEEWIFLGENIPTEGVQESMFEERSDYWCGKEAKGEFNYNWTDADGKTITLEEIAKKRPETDQVYTLTVTFTPFTSGETGAAASGGNKVTAVDGSNTYTIHVVSGSVTVEKKILKKDINLNQGDPIFTFSLTNEDTGKVLYGYVRFNKEKLENMEADADGYVALRTTFSGLPKGTYTVEELDSSRYDLDGSAVLSGEGSYPANTDSDSFFLGRKADGTRDINSRDGKAVFSNKKTGDEYFSDTDIVVNRFTVENGKIVIRPEKVTVESN